jgi:hypothetical protein
MTTKSPFDRPTWQAARDPSFLAELEAYIAAIPINQRPVNPDLGDTYGCGDSCQFPGLKLL